MKILRIIAFLEGISLIILLAIAMPLKYYANNPEPVKIIGMAHGILFIFYVINVIYAQLTLSWTYKKTALALIASIIPFGTFYADKKLFRN